MVWFTRWVVGWRERKKSLYWKLKLKVVFWFNFSLSLHFNFPFSRFSLSSSEAVAVEVTVGVSVAGAIEPVESKSVLEKSVQRPGSGSYWLVVMKLRCTSVTSVHGERGEFNLTGVCMCVCVCVCVCVLHVYICVRCLLLAAGAKGKRKNGESEKKGQVAGKANDYLVSHLHLCLLSLSLSTFLPLAAWPVKWSLVSLARVLYLNIQQQQWCNWIMHVSHSISRGYNGESLSLSSFSLPFWPVAWCVSLCHPAFLFLLSRPHSVNWLYQWRFILFILFILFIQCPFSIQMKRQSERNAT